MVIVSTDTPDLFARHCIDGIKVGDDVTKIGGRDAIESTLTQGDAGAHFRARRKGPAHAARIQIECIDRSVLAAHEYSTHCNSRL